MPPPPPGGLRPISNGGGGSRTKARLRPTRDNALVRATVGVVSAAFGTVSHFALCKYAPMSEQRSLLFPSNFWTLVWLSKVGGGGGGGVATQGQGCPGTALKNILVSGPNNRGCGENQPMKHSIAPRSELKATFSTGPSCDLWPVTRGSYGEPSIRCFIPPPPTGTGQDWWLYMNHFRYARPRGGGVYLDVAANDPVHSSNTFVLDHCLGWAGVCVEPSPAHHARLAAHRSCALVPTCVSDAPRAVEFLYDPREADVLGKGMMDGIVGANANEGKLLASRAFRRVLSRRNLTCTTATAAVLARGLAHVDVLSLDVEGHEAAVLRGLDLGRVAVDVVVVERNGAAAAEWLRARGYAMLPHNETGCFPDDVFLRPGLRWGFEAAGVPMRQCACPEAAAEEALARRSGKRRKRGR